MKKEKIIKALLISQGVSQKVIAERLNVGQTTLNSRINRGNISVDLLLKILDAMNCKLVIVPDSAKLPKEAYEVTTE